LIDTKVSHDTFVQLCGSNDSGGIALFRRPNRMAHNEETIMKILMVLTSHDQLGDTGRKTGFWLEEFAAPDFVFRDAGVELTLASPNGGQPPVDPKVIFLRIRHPQWHGSSRMKPHKPLSPNRKLKRKPRNRSGVEPAFGHDHFPCGRLPTPKLALNF